ncbi:hypothetical protein HBI54_069700 [Parastagonospora nodorum]|nr:hypothetical protein HBI54_069700 [Parastagonospora nodorum]
MAKGPAVVVVARHGARLDAADKTWHLTSPTPYDPPLTFGGWQQGRALGLRIAALLHQRDNEQLEAAKSVASGESPRPKKKRKIVIHSSPYLRCIQTSTAVAAGISQFNPPTVPQLGVPVPSKEKAAATEKPKQAKPSQGSPYITPLADPKAQNSHKPHAGPERVLLRVDAFLGEWLSPDYYEDITPPPNSTLMVAGAKADLLRRGDAMLEMSHTKTSKGFFPGGWMGKGASAAAQPETDHKPRSKVRSLAAASPFNRERSSSQGASPLQRTKSRENLTSLAPAAQNPNSRVYEPPVPTYSVSPADHIPRGYFAHAREACIVVDFQWDSMRPPQEWGDGGEYGDEWSTMHKRFRRGLTGMMDWYREHGATPPKNQISGFMFKEPLRLTPVPAAKRPTEPFSLDKGDGPDEDEELVLIIMTHGAGCNALLGAMANQPVLMDIGLASLSMAVRREVPREPSEATIHERRLSVADPGMAETYDMKIMASVDHLKPGTDPSKIQSQSRTNSPAVLASPSLEARRRMGGSAASSPGDTPVDPFRTWNSSAGLQRRTMSSGSNKLYTQSNLNPGSTSTAPGGLWGSAKPSPAVTPGGSDGVATPNATSQPRKTTSNVEPSISAFDGAADITNGLERLNTNERHEVSDSVAPLAPLPKTQANGRAGGNASGSGGGLWGAKTQPKSTAGLWGPPRLDDVYEHRPGPKRRWTVTEREESL